MLSWIIKHKAHFLYFIAGCGIAVFSTLYTNIIEDHTEKHKELVTISNIQDDLVEIKVLQKANNDMLSDLMQDRVETKTKVVQLEKRIDNLETITYHR